MLKKIILFFALMATLPSLIFAQNFQKILCKDEPCVLEILKKFNSQDASEVADAVKMLEYLANEARLTDDSDLKNALKNSILAFVGKFENCSSNNFLISLLSKFCSASDCSDIMQLIENEQFADIAIRTVGDISGTDGIIEKYIMKNHDNPKHNAALAYAVGKLGMSGMKNELVSWLKGADNLTKYEIYNALLVIGDDAKTHKIVEKGAKKLYKNKDAVTKVNGMRLFVAMKGEESLPYLYKSLKNKDLRVREGALELLVPFANPDVCATVLEKCSKNDSYADVVAWLGDVKDQSQVGFVIAQLSSDDRKTVEAAVRALVKIGDADGMNALIPMFGGEYQQVIKEAMLQYEGDFCKVMSDVIKGNDQQKLAVLEMLDSRPCISLHTDVRRLLYYINPEVKDAAFKALPSVVLPSHADFLRELLISCDEKYVGTVQTIIKNVMKNADNAKKDNFVSLLKYVQPEIMPRFYEIFAYFGTELSVNKLIEAYNSSNYKDEARKALLLVDNEEFTEIIRDILK